MRSKFTIFTILVKSLDLGSKDFFMSKYYSKKEKVFVGVSGGVDSSVALALLMEQGFEVVGVFIRTWQPDWIECTWQQERRDAMRVCAHLDVLFIELDLEQEYKQGVADYMINEYRLGRTPNPDVMCNREVKFGGFLKWAQHHGADYVATGHYARVVEKTKNVEFLRGHDAGKDQSYFLWTLNQDQLRHVLFPIGDFLKKKVRALAKKYKLPTATKKDSQGICFIGEVDMKEFLSHYIDEKKGDVINEKGEVIGFHKGVLFYTLGERHGFEIFPNYKGTEDKPYYVIAKDIQKNILLVSQNKNNKKQTANQIHLYKVVDNQDIFKEGMRLQAQFRYHGAIEKVLIKHFSPEDNTMIIECSSHQDFISPGQSVVLYNGDMCLGGGIIY